jgi:hypothetical protein
MELSDKTIQNLTALASHCLRGEKINEQPYAMQELWGDIAAATTYLQRDKTPPGSIPCAMPDVDHA